MSGGGPPPDVSVVVASFNTRDLLRQCLESLALPHGDLQLETVVVDNNSRDGSPEMVAREFPRVTLLRNEENEGFARANNRALTECHGRYVLLLNSDTVLPQVTLEPMVEFLEANPDVGIAGCRVVRPDGRLDEACKRSFPTPISALSRFLALDRLFPRHKTLGSYRRTWEDPEGCYEVDSVVGAFMLVRRQTLDDVGGLDEDFFMFGEDLDWCYRVKRKKWRIVYLGDRHVIHHKGASTVREPHRMNWHFHRSMALFHKKHLVDRYPFFVNWAVYAGIAVRYALRGTKMLIRGGKSRPRPLAGEAVDHRATSSQGQGESGSRATGSRPALKGPFPEARPRARPSPRKAEEEGEAHGTGG